ncbi:hypothetical protein SDC9_200576 [bioreactor metagenome]|uniref:Uncharacterized protein n=1 Tax=bioreactor metagenome TaxID=1076179 RepID=A0A645J0E0_9ZZZZ
MIFVQPITYISGSVQRFYLVKRDNASHLPLFENKEHFGVAALMQHHIALHILAGVLHRSHKLRPVQRLLEPDFIFKHQLMQRGDVLFFDGTQFQRVTNDNYF